MDRTLFQICSGHADVVKALVRAGASCTDENKAGFTGRFRRIVPNRSSQNMILSDFQRFIWLPKMVTVLCWR